MTLLDPDLVCRCLIMFLDRKEGVVTEPEHKIVEDSYTPVGDQPIGEQEIKNMRSALIMSNGTPCVRCVCA